MHFRDKRHPIELSSDRAANMHYTTWLPGTEAFRSRLSRNFLSCEIDSGVESLYRFKATLQQQGIEFIRTVH